MKTILLSFALLWATNQASAQSLTDITQSNMKGAHGLVGFATLPAYQMDGITGGAMGQLVIAENEEQLRAYCQAEQPYTILFEGEISRTDEVDIAVASNKTIIGCNGRASLNGIGFEGENVSNIIIRGFRITNAHCDAIAFKTSHHIWIDHCDLSASDDGLLDMTVGSDLMTASWNRFANHNKTSIINSGTQHSEDKGKERISYHHNHFTNTKQRNPRVGYGLGHLWNNLYEGIRSYCIGYFDGARLRVENSCFKNCKTPFQQMYVQDPNNEHFGHCEQLNNIFIGCKGNMEGTGSSFDVADYYDYSLTMEATEQVADIVEKGAGVVKGLEYDLIPIPNSGTIQNRSTLSRLQWSKAPQATKYLVYGSSSAELLQSLPAGDKRLKPLLIGKTKQAQCKLKHSVQNGETYYWRVDTQLKGRTIQGKVWSFRVAK